MIMARYLMLATVLTTPVVAYAESTQEQAKAYVQTVANRVIDILNNNKGNLDKRRAAFADLFEQQADVQRMAAFTAGPLWNSASEATRSEYVKVFTHYMATSYARRFESYYGEKVNIGRVTDAGKRGIVVDSSIERGEQPPVSLTWQLRPVGDGTFKVRDILAEQISMLVTHKTEFAALAMNMSQPSLEGLTAALKRRTAG